MALKGQGGEKAAKRRRVVKFCETVESQGGGAVKGLAAGSEVVTLNSLDAVSAAPPPAKQQKKKLARAGDGTHAAADAVGPHQLRFLQPGDTKDQKDGEELMKGSFKWGVPLYQKMVTHVSGAVQAEGSGTCSVVLLAGGEKVPERSALRGLASVSFHPDIGLAELPFIATDPSWRCQGVGYFLAQGIASVIAKQTQEYPLLVSEIIPENWSKHWKRWGFSYWADWREQHARRPEESKQQYQNRLNADTEAQLFAALPARVVAAFDKRRTKDVGLSLDLIEDRGLELVIIPVEKLLKSSELKYRVREIRGQPSLGWLELANLSGLAKLPTKGTAWSVSRAGQVAAVAQVIGIEQGQLTVGCAFLTRSCFEKAWRAFAPVLVAAADAAKASSVLLALPSQEFRTRLGVSALPATERLVPAAKNLRMTRKLPSWLLKVQPAAAPPPPQRGEAPAEAAGTCKCADKVARAREQAEQQEASATPLAAAGPAAVGETLQKFGIRSAQQAQVPFVIELRKSPKPLKLFATFIEAGSAAPDPAGGGEEVPLGMEDGPLGQQIWLQSFLSSRGFPHWLSGAREFWARGADDAMELRDLRKTGVCVVLASRPVQAADGTDWRAHWKAATAELVTSCHIRNVGAVVVFGPKLDGLMGAPGVLMGRLRKLGSGSPTTVKAGAAAADKRFGVPERTLKSKMESLWCIVQVCEGMAAAMRARDQSSSRSRSRSESASSDDEFAVHFPSTVRVRKPLVKDSSRGRAVRAPFSFVRKASKPRAPVSVKRQCAASREALALAPPAKRPRGPPAPQQ